MLLFYVRKKETLRRCCVFRRRRRRRGLPFEFGKREREQQQQQQQQNHARHHQYHAFVKVYIIRVLRFPCRGLHWNCLGYLVRFRSICISNFLTLRAHIYYPICGHCYSLKANNNVRRRSLHRRFQILRPTHHRPSIRPIFQRHNRFERKREIEHFGFHLLRPRDHEFKSGTITIYKRRIRSRWVFFLLSFLLSFAFGNDRIRVV